MARAKGASAKKTVKVGDAATDTAKAAAKTTELKESRKAVAPRVAESAGTEEVVVKGRPLDATLGAAKGKAVVVEPDVTDEKKLKGTRVVHVKAIHDGYYGHRLRTKEQGDAGITFEMRVGPGELPSWVEEVGGDSPKKQAKIRQVLKSQEPRRTDDKDVINTMLGEVGLDAAGNKAVDGDKVI